MCLLRPSKEINHDPVTGAMRIRTLTSFKNFNMDFTIGKEFTEDLGPVDGRTCQVRVVGLNIKRSGVGTILTLFALETSVGYHHITWCTGLLYVILIGKVCGKSTGPPAVFLCCGSPPRPQTPLSPQ